MTRAPLVPSGSFDTCTRMTCPLRSISSIGVTDSRFGSMSTSTSASPSSSAPSIVRA